MIHLKELKQDVIIILDHQDNEIEIDRAKFEEWVGVRLWETLYRKDYWEHVVKINDNVFQHDMSAFLTILSQEGLS